MKGLIVFVSLLSVSLACEAWPNGTDQAYVWWPSCGGPVVYYTASITDLQGNPEYPVRLTDPVIITVDADNQGRVYDSPNLRVSVDIWSWTNQGAQACKWVSVPTLGLLSDLDACEEGIPCPVQTGRQLLPLTMDFTKYNSIIKLLKDDAPYELTLTLNDKLSGDKTCVTAQARCRTK